MPTQDMVPWSVVANVSRPNGQVHALTLAGAGRAVHRAEPRWAD